IDGDSSLSVDSAAALPGGEVWIAGTFQGSISIQGVPFTSNGSSDLFLARYDQAGDLVFARQDGGTALDTSPMLAAQPDGGVVMGFRFSGTATLGAGGPNPVDLTSDSSSNIGLARFSADGELLWATQARSTRTQELAGVATSPDQTVIIAGAFRGTTTLGRLGGDIPDLVTDPSRSDIFVARLNPAGTFLWARQATGPQGDQVFALAGMPDGGAALIGLVRDQVLFDTVPVGIVGGGSQQFIARYDEGGNVVYARARSGGSAHDLSAHLDGSVTVAGDFKAETVPELFGDGDPGATSLLSLDRDGFLARYHPDGSLAGVRRDGGPESELALATDSLPDGGLVVTGGHGLGAVFGSGEVAQTELNHPQFHDALFVARYEPVNYRVLVARPTGHAWALTNTGETSTGGEAVAGLPDGGAIVLGELAGTTLAVFGTGEPTQTSIAANPANKADVFLARYAGDGSLVWARRDGGTEREQARGVATFPDGGSIACGNWEDAPMVFGNPAAPDITFPAATVDGQLDIWLARYDPDGNPVWAAAAQGALIDVANGVSAAIDGGALVCGRFRNEVTFGDFVTTPTDGTNLSTNTVPLSSGDPNNDDGYIARYDPDGQPLWAARFGGSENSIANAVAALTDGGGVVVGDYRGTSASVVSATAAATALPDSTTADNSVVARFDAAGEVVWARSIRGDETSNALSVAALPDGGAVVVGDFRGTTTFGGEGGQGDLTVALGTTGKSPFVARYDRNGLLVFAIKGDTSNASAEAVAALPDGSLWVTGLIETSFLAFGGPLFDPGAKTLSRTGTDDDAFVLKLGPTAEVLSLTAAEGEVLSTAAASLADGSLFLTGVRQSAKTLIFGPGESNPQTIPAGNGRFFLSKRFDAPN
ncbi:MAG: hypothetical protein ACYTFT_02715, partial [Planctomycetota bacterium]